MSLKISKEQSEVFQRSVEVEFTRSIMNGLRANHPDLARDIPDEELLDKVQSGIKRASRYGFTQKYSYALFVELMFLVAPNFDDSPPIQSILRRPDIESDRKLDQIIETTTERQWQSAKRRSDLRAWKTY